MKIRFIYCPHCDMTLRHILKDGEYVCQGCLKPNKNNTHDIIDNMIEELEKVVKDGQNDIEAYKYLKKIASKDTVSTEEVDMAMEVTCYGHFAGCCGPEKACPIHLSVCEALRLNPEELFQVKKDAVDAWLTEKLHTYKGGN